jgi:hypothetical protein
MPGPQKSKPLNPVRFTFQFICVPGNEPLLSAAARRLGSTRN